MMPRLGIIARDPDGVFQSTVIAGASALAEARGYEAMVWQSADDLPFNQASGLLVIANALADEILSDLYQTGIPISLVSHYIPGLPIPSLAPSNAQGIKRLVRHLVEDCNRRKLVFIQGDMQQRDGWERDWAFRQEVMRYNLAVPDTFFLPGHFLPLEAANTLTKLLQTTSDFDGVVAADYLMALAALDVLKAAGLRVPQDVAVVGAGDGAEAQPAGLTTVGTDIHELGRRAARQLIGQIEGMRVRGQTRLSATLIVRATSCERG